MVRRDCALCGESQSLIVLYEQNVGVRELLQGDRHTGWRRVPHYRIVKCARCGLVFSTPVLDPALVDELYRQGSRVVSQNYHLETASNVRGGSAAPSRQY